MNKIIILVICTLFFGTSALLSQNATIILDGGQSFRADFNLSVQKIGNDGKYPRNGAAPSQFTLIIEKPFDGKQVNLLSNLFLNRPLNNIRIVTGSGSNQLNILLEQVLINRYEFDIDLTSSQKEIITLNAARIRYEHPGGAIGSFDFISGR